jgi:TonB family protein
MPGPRIADLVFQGEPRRGRRGLGALLLATILHAAVGLWLLEQRPTLEGWSAEVAARVHEELNRVEIVELPPSPSPPEPPPQPSEPMPPPQPSEPAPVPVSAPPAPRTRLKVGNPPAKAAKVLAAAPGALDLTGEVFVEGKGDAYAGGATSPGGTGQHPSSDVGAPPAQPKPDPPREPNRPSRAAPVSLRSGQWNCPWPDAAADLPLDEMTATIRVTVRADGSVETSAIVEDPGDGFAPAALRCARATRFTPATDADGRPIRAVSPPIRVHFYR